MTTLNELANETGTSVDELISFFDLPAAFDPAMELTEDGETWMREAIDAQAAIEEATR